MEEGFMWQEPILEVPLTRIQQINQILSRGGMNPGEVQEFVGKELHQQVFLAIKMKSMSLVEWYTLNCLDRMPRMRDKHLNTLLMAAIESGSPEIFELLKNVGIDIHHKNKNRHTALHLGVKKGLYDVVEWLIENHANVNDVGRVYQNLETTPLYLAAEHGHLQLVQMLLNAGASVRYCGPLWVAVRGGKLDIVRILVGGNMPIGNSVILLAVNRQNWEIINYFLEIEEVKSRVLSAAAKSERVEVFNTLLRRTDIIKTAGENTNALLIATKSGNERVVNMLLNSQEYNPSLVSREHPSCEIYVSQHEARNFADIEFEEIRRYEYNAIALAISKNYLEIARLLLIDGRVNPSAISLQICSKRGYTTLIPLLISDARIDVNARDFEDKTALQHAVESKNTDIVETLLDHGDINPNIGEPLWIALAFNERRIVELLLSHHKINLKTIEGRNSLIVGIENGNVDIVALVLGEQAVDPNSVDDDGKSAVGLAIRTNSNQKYRILGLLFDDERLNPNLAGNFDDTSPFHHVISISTAGAGRAMFNLFFEDSRTDINLMNDETPLHTAVSCEQIWIIEELLAHSEIQPNIKDRHGQSPLYRAVLGGKPEIVQALLHSREIDVNTVDEGSNRTALIEAVSQGNLEIISLLLEAEALDINYVIGNTFALRLAATKGDLDVVERLLSHKGIDPDIYLKSSDTNLLFEAVASANVPLIKKLVASNRLNPNYRHRATRETPLMHAMAIERRDIVKLLLNSDRIDINCDNNEQRLIQCIYKKNWFDIFQVVLEHPQVDRSSLLHWSVLHNEDKLSLDLLKHENIDINYFCQHTKNTILMQAVQSKNLEIVRSCLEHPKIDVLKKVEERSAISVASKLESLDMLELLLEYLKFSCSEYDLENCNTANVLYVLICRDKQEEIKAIVRTSKVNLNQTILKSSNSLLLEIILDNKPGILKIFIQSKCIDDGINQYFNGNTAFHAAIKMNNTRIVKLLMDVNQLDPNLCLISGNSPFYYAVQHCNLDIIEYMANDNRVKVNILNQDTGRTPLMEAVYANKIQIVKLLLACRQVKINIQHESVSALTLAHEKQDPTIFNLLLNDSNLHTDSIISEGLGGIFAKYVEDGNVETVSTLLKKRNNTTIIDVQLFFTSIDRNDIKIIKAMLSNNSVDLGLVSGGLDSLRKASTLKRSTIFSFLLKQDGINPNIKINGTTLLYDLVGNFQKKEYFNLLVEHKDIDVNTINENIHRSILMQAVYTEDKHAFKKLLKHRALEINRVVGGASALNVSINLARWSYVDLLLKHKDCNPDLETHESENLLFDAVDSNNTELATMLLNHSSIDVNRTHPETNKSLLMRIIENKNSDLLKVILKKRSLDINHTAEGSTALDIAAKESNESSMLPQLMRHPKIKTMEVNSHTDTWMLYFSILNDNFKNLKYLIEEKQVDPNDYYFHHNTTALIHAVTSKKYKAIKLLLKSKKIELDLAVNDETALLFATKTDDSEFRKIARLLVKALGKESHKPKLHRFQEIMCNVLNFGNYELAKSLIETSRIDTNMIHLNSNLSLLCHTIHHDIDEIFSALLKVEDLEINLVINGRFPLLEAVKESKLKYIKNILKHSRVDVNQAVEDEDGSPIMQAIESNNTKILKLLLTHQDIDVNLVVGDMLPVKKAIMIYPNHKNFAIIEMLLKSKIDLKKKIPNTTRTVLFDCIKNHKDVAIRLIAHESVDINLIDEETGRSILMEAIDARDKELVQHILKHEDINTDTVISNKTPLMYAIEIGDFEICSLLLESRRVKKELLIDVEDENVATSALQVAVQQGNKDVLKKLLLEDKIHIDDKDKAYRLATYSEESLFGEDELHSMLYDGPPPQNKKRFCTMFFSTKPQRPMDRFSV